MNTTLTLDHLPAMNRALKGNDFKIVLDLLQSADRIEDPENGVLFQAPVDEIALRTDLSPATVYKRLRALIDEGKLRVVRDWTRGRGGAAKVYAISL